MISLVLFGSYLPFTHPFHTFILLINIRTSGENIEREKIEVLQMFYQVFWGPCSSSIKFVQSKAPDQNVT